MSRQQASPQSLVDEVKQGGRMALSRCITLLENGGPESQGVIAALPLDLPLDGKSRCYRIGITGAPGVGKSTLINAMIKHLRGQGKKVAVLAVDPTSPFSGGAILGDRVRMVEHGGDRDVFIRSLGSRGNPDGLSTSIPYIMRLLDLYGTEICLVETVGSGQLDVLVKAFVDTTLLLLSPEGGDEIQMMKAGILEIADVMAINKSDRKGVEHIEHQLQAWLDLLPKSRSWRPPIIKIQANNGTGVEELYGALSKHRDHLPQITGAADAVEHRKFMILNLSVALFRHRCSTLLEDKEFSKLLKSKNGNAVTAAQALIAAFKEDKS